MLDIGHFRARVLQDALAEATATYWLHRAAALEDARPRGTDRPGRATPDQLAAADARLAQAAALCRHRAGIARYQTATSEEVSQALEHTR